jgi:hypothetical protein
MKWPLLNRHRIQKSSIPVRFQCPICKKIGPVQNFPAHCHIHFPKYPFCGPCGRFFNNNVDLLKYESRSVIHSTKTNSLKPSTTIPLLQPMSEVLQGRARSDRVGKSNSLPLNELVHFLEDTELAITICRAPGKETKERYEKRKDSNARSERDGTNILLG